MRGIPVLFNDNHYKVVSGLELNLLLMTGRVKAFRRSTGWAVIGHDPLRGKGGKYTGPERRGLRGRRCNNGSRFQSQQATMQEGRSCLTCNNLVEGICLSKAFWNNYEEVGNYINQ